MSAKIVTPQDVSYQSANGTIVYGCLRKPAGKGPFPAVVLIHGGWGNNKEFTRNMLKWGIADLLLQEKYVLLSTDYRDVLVNPDYGADYLPKDIDDVVAAFKYVSKLPFVDENRIAYFGDSHGSYLALMAAIQTNPKAIIFNWSVANLAKWCVYIKNSHDQWYRKLANSLQKAFGGTPEQEPEIYRQVSPVAHVHRIRCPVLINHGEEDEFVPVAHAYELAKALENARCKYELKIYKDATHGLHNPQAVCEMNVVTLKFLKKYMKKIAYA